MNTEELKEYFKKIKRIISYETDFNFLDIGLIKTTKIDDVICCILANFPDSYKMYFRKRKEKKQLESITYYNMLTNALKNKFIFNSNVYLVHKTQACKLIDLILKTIDKDIEYAEKNQ